MTHYITKNNSIYFIVAWLILTSLTPVIFQSQCLSANLSERKMETNDPAHNESYPLQPLFYMPEINETKSGYLKIVWGFSNNFQANEDITFELQRSLDPMFRSTTTIYAGPDYATFLSGLPDDTYYYRVRFIAGENPGISNWSDSITVHVEHHSLKLSFLLFGLGFIVVAATFVLVIRGSVNNR